jgi:hypothetical protein
MRERIKLMLCVLILNTASVLGQQNQNLAVGVWKYAIKENPFGKFSGQLLLTVDESGHLMAKIINSVGVQFSVKIIRTTESRLVFSSDFEQSDATFFCDFELDQITGFIEVKGDSFLYQMSGVRSLHQDH